MKDYLHIGKIFVLFVLVMLYMPMVATNLLAGKWAEAWKFVAGTVDFYRKNPGKLIAPTIGTVVVIAMVSFIRRKLALRWKAMGVAF